VDEPDLAIPFLEGGFQIGVDYGRDIARAEAMQVDTIFNGQHSDRLVERT
jgi:hypothetical protein